MKKTLLLTGATGYIGSHAVVAFEQAGYTTVIVDNLLNSSTDSLDGISKILGYTPDFYEGDICDKDFLRGIFQKYTFDGVIHFAGLKSVGESVEKPLYYHENNIGGSMTLFRVMQDFGVKKIIFSSSATVYDPINAPIYREWQSLGTTNPYWTTKMIIEYLLKDLAETLDWQVGALRYFNPIGAHPSGYIGEVPNGIPNNLLPYVLDVATGKREKVSVYGDDYDTIDGTGVRDYIDVCDLVDAHVVAYEKLDNSFCAINIGTGKGTSVLEMIQYVREASGKEIAYQIAARRPGDIAEFYCDPSLAHSFLGWSAKRSIAESVKNSWNFVSQKYE